MSFLSCAVTPKLFKLLQDLADDDGSLRSTLTGNRDQLIVRLGHDAEDYLPDSWTLPSKDECQIFVDRYETEGRGHTYGESIMHFAQDVRDKWV